MRAERKGEASDWDDGEIGLTAVDVAIEMESVDGNLENISGQSE